MKTLQRIALVLVIIGALNWGLIGFFRFDLVASIFGGQTSAISRIIYALVGISGLACLPLLFSPSNAEQSQKGTNSQNYGKLNYGTEFAEESEIAAPNFRESSKQASSKSSDQSSDQQ
jgi:uncharacterized protein